MIRQKLPFRAGISTHIKSKKDEKGKRTPNQDDILLILVLSDYLLTGNDPCKNDSARDIFSDFWTPENWPETASGSMRVWLRSFLSVLFTVSFAAKSRRVLLEISKRSSWFEWLFVHPRQLPVHFRDPKGVSNKSRSRFWSGQLTKKQKFTKNDSKPLSNLGRQAFPDTKVELSHSNVM